MTMQATKTTMTTKATLTVQAMTVQAMTKTSRPSAWWWLLALGSRRFDLAPHGSVPLPRQRRSRVPRSAAAGRETLRPRWLKKAA